MLNLSWFEFVFTTIETWTVVEGFICIMKNIQCYHVTSLLCLLYALTFLSMMFLSYSDKSWACTDMIFWSLLSDPKTHRADGKESLYMFIVRVILGNIFICRTPTPFRKPPCTGQDCHKDNCTDQSHQPFFHSVVGTHKEKNTRLIFREFIIYDRHQAYPEFLIEYERQ